MWGWMKVDERHGKLETKKRPNIRRLKTYESVALPTELGWRNFMKSMYLA